jgi:hypothetical protein
MTNVFLMHILFTLHYVYLYNTLTVYLPFLFACQHALALLSLLDILVVLAKPSKQGFAEFTHASIFHQ